MKRFHIHVGVKDISASVQFYSTLFGKNPTKLKEDYAKWMLDEPRLNFAISTRSSAEGIDHLGIQVEEEAELAEITARLKNAGMKVFAEGETTCCYAESKKAWVQDPSGLAWETYRNMADAEVYSAKPTNSCCAPTTSSVKASCC